MIRLAPVQVALAAIAFVVMAIVAPIAAAIGWRVAFLTAGGPMLGGVLMLAVATLTGARWPAFASLSAASPAAVIAAVGIGVIQLASPAPAHLALWQHPVAVGLRAVIVAGAIAWAGNRLVRSATLTFAAVFLAAYAVCVTVIGSDWMLGGSAGHGLSAIGMILFVEQIGGACGMILLVGWGNAGFRRDMGKLLAACALGLSYLAFMDFLILWYGDVPSRIGWYVARSSLGAELLLAAALMLGLFVPIAALSLIGGRHGERVAGLGALMGLALFNLWWVGGGVIAAVAACGAGWLIVSAGFFVRARRAAHDGPR